MSEQQNFYPHYDENLWLRSCTEEILKPLSGKIVGTIPEWINGDLIRNGPGSLTVGDNRFEHIFDSLALLHKFAIKDGEVTYQCRFLQSNAYKINTTAKRIVTTGFGTKSVPDPCHNVFQRIASKFVKNNVFDNSSVSVYPFHDELYAFGEFPIIHRINQENLDTEEALNVNKLDENITVVHHSAHPHIDKDGSVYNLATTLHGNKPHHSIVCFPLKPNVINSLNDRSMFEKAKVVANIPVRWTFHPTYMHSFGITENYFLIIEQPWCLSVPRIIKNQLTNEPIANCFCTRKNEMTRFSVINRKTKEVKNFYSEAFFYFHIINQYELSNNIVVDVCTYEEPLGIEWFFVETMKNTQTNPKAADNLRSRPLRFTLPLVESTHNGKRRKSKSLTDLINFESNRIEASKLKEKIFVEPVPLCNLGCETPRINYEKYSGKEYQYFYAVSMDIDAKNPGMLIKVDTNSKSTLTWYEENCYASEPIFVASPDSKAEDDGVLLASLLWGGDDTNHVGLVVLDAKTMKEIGRAEFHTPSSIPKCFHGWFSPNKVSKL